MSVRTRLYTTKACWEQENDQLRKEHTNWLFNTNGQPWMHTHTSNIIQIEKIIFMNIYVYLNKEEAWIWKRKKGVSEWDLWEEI